MLKAWSFWIDVGGTFTDCLAESPDGITHFTKVLSSGRTKGVATRRVSPVEIVDQVRTEVDGFWNGAQWVGLDPHGQPICRSRVISFADGCFTLESPLPDNIVAQSCYDLETNLHAPVLAMHQIMQVPLESSLSDVRVQLGTTRGTNALLTRSGSKTAFVTNRGYRDLLRIGDQARPELFRLSVVNRQPLCESSFELDCRVLADGTVEVPVDELAAQKLFEDLANQGFESVAICLIHAFRFPEQEQQLKNLARPFGFRDVSCSSDVAPVIKMLPRSETVTLDAYLNPVLAGYLGEIRNCLTDASELEMMTSSGGLVSHNRFSGKDSVLSGPAGGVVGAARIAEQLGCEKIIGFDMGGTSTDVARYDGNFEFEYESIKAGVRLVSPTLAIETVAAGGGSVCWFDGSRLLVGPQSAASDPGPACYGNGGPLTVTDVNLFLGRVVTERFPFPLNATAVRFRIHEIQQELAEAGFERTIEEVAAGFLEIANSQMASAIQNVSVAKGYDPEEYTLVSFGGAGSQHCCAVAEKLGIRRVIDHPLSSILSAVGISLADQKAEKVVSILKELDATTFQQAVKAAENLTQLALDELEDNSDREIRVHRLFDLRYKGTEPFLTVPGFTERELQNNFEELHRQRFGYIQERSIELVSVRVQAARQTKRLSPTVMAAGTFKAMPYDVIHNYSCARWVSETMEIQRVDAEVFLYSELKPGAEISGPAIVVDSFKTTIVDKLWKAVFCGDGQILLERTEEMSQSPEQFVDASLEDVADPVKLELFNRQFSSIATRMGESLQRTSCSVNVKERLDFSCAIFTFDGDLVVNAPHIPVHLGAMSETIRSIIRMNPDVQEGDVLVTNDPFAGGSHLPDVTVVQPVHVDGQLRFWVASRSHHSELGGIAPGSMPAYARNLAEEGVLIQNLKLVDRGCERFSELRAVLTDGKYPSRSPDQNIADIQAQIAANKKGEQELVGLVRESGFEQVDRYMRFMAEAAEAKAREAICNLPDGVNRFADQMDNGKCIRVEIRIENCSMSIDFTGTDPVSEDNMNANRAIVQAAVMYVVRSLIPEDIPLNEGVLRPVDLKLPESFIHPRAGRSPEESPAVVGGNVETSQRIVDVLLGALGLCAASQGTMNNWLMGNADFGYYETVGGGVGATADGPGADAVHSHMTNTRLTDPEVLETRYPVILRAFRVRENSGGAGRHRGGHGMLRQVEFRAPLKLSLLTNRRKLACYGASGGLPGRPGSNEFVYANGETTELPHQVEMDVEVGDQLVLKTPGGGGWGPPGS